MTELVLLIPLAALWFAMNERAKRIAVQVHLGWIHAVRRNDVSCHMAEVRNGLAQGKIVTYGGESI